MDNPWLDIRNSAGHLLFRYNPWTNEIEFRKGGYAYDVIRLDEIRVQFGIIELEEPGSMLIVTIQEKRNGNKP
jgi:hypothetical protein